MSKTIITPKGKAVWPRIDTPDTKFDEDGVYTCKLHVSESDFKAFEALIQPDLDAAYKEECRRQGKEKIKMAPSSPLRITDEGDYEIFAKQNAKVRTKDSGTLEFSVTAIDSQGKKITKLDEEGEEVAFVPRIGSGSTLKLSVLLKTWFVPSQGFGYSLRLRAVQLLDLIEYGGGDNFGFSAEKDGYVGSSESLNDAFEVADEAETSNAPF